MFGIPELDELVFQQLNRQELARCMRVNKKWHEAAVPFLWSDLTYLEQLPRKQRQAFGKLVLEDYLQAQQHRKLKEEGQDMGHPTSPISNLAKYGRCIRLLKAKGLITLLESNNRLQQAQEERPTCYELFLHFLDYCPKAQVSSLHYGYLEYVSPNLLPMVVERVLPRVLDLEIRAAMKVRQLMELLDRCSSNLMSLEIDVELEDSKNEMDDQQEEEIPASKGWTSLTHLKLGEWGDHPGYTMLRRWLLRRCNCVQKIEVCKASIISPRFVKDALTYMPNLKEVVIKGALRGNNAAAILSASRHGWRSVTIEYRSLDKAAKMSLARHFSTLEMLDVSLCGGFTGDELVQVLSSCPHLRTLNDHVADETPIHASTLIDQDPSTGLLKAWACETSLKVLQTKITGIPRPDLKMIGLLDTFLVEEAYEGQGREMQGLVYD
ncbi:MAG: hypothetical protein J3Q66DRAFT_57388 [Benniella sp.]|nr:MAG: hypothetical protein J3Q66DRAFT_57388 [Benniella sp.]